MSTPKKLLALAVLAVAIAAALYQTRRVSSLRAEMQALQTNSVAQSRTSAEKPATSLQAKVEALTAEKEELIKALAQAHAQNGKLAHEREQANHSMALFKDLVEQSRSQDSSATNQYPTPRHVWAAFGKFGRLMALSKDEDNHLSADEKTALDEAKMKALGQLPALIQAAKQLDAFKSAGGSAGAEDVSDNVACLFYGALNLDEQQFGQVYGLMQNYAEQAKQQGLFETNAPPEQKTAMVGQMLERFKGDMQGLLTPEQSRIFGEVVKQIKLEPGNFSFSFNF